MAHNTLFLLATTLILGAAPALLAQNLVPNPGFEGDTSSWQAYFGGSLTWAKADEANLEDSGSARISDLAAHQNITIHSACFPVDDTGHIVVGGSFFSPEGNNGQGFVTLRLYGDDTCTTGNLVPPSAPHTAPFGRSTWTPSQRAVPVPPGAKSGNIRVTISSYSVAPTEVFVDNVFAIQGATCADTLSTLCLNDGRFLVTGEWRKPDGTRGAAQVESLTSDSGYLWFFNPANIENVLKVLDACSYNNHFWVFAAGLTNLGVTLDITDSLTGTTWHHENPNGEAFQPVLDAEAFATCEP